jgi:hypothetical protein
MKGVGEGELGERDVRLESKPTGPGPCSMERWSWQLKHSAGLEKSEAEGESPFPDSRGVWPVARGWGWERARSM